MPARSALLEITFLNLNEADRLVSIIDADRERNIPGRLIADKWEQRAALRGLDPSELTPSKLKASTECCLFDGVWRKPRLCICFQTRGIQRERSGIPISIHTDTLPNMDPEALRFRPRNRLHFLCASSALYAIPPFVLPATFIPSTLPFQKAAICFWMEGTAVRHL